LVLGISSLISCLAFGDHIWSVSVIITYAILLHNPDYFGHALCVICRGLFQVGAASTLWWSACAAIYMYYAILREEKSVPISNTMWIIFHSVSWGVPIILYVIPLSLGQIQPSTLGICFPTYKWRLTAWFIPNAILFAIIAFFYLMTFLRMRKTQALMTITERHGLWKRLSFYLLVIFICWFLDFLAFFIFREECVPHWVSVAYAMLLQLQGFFDAVVYSVSTREIVDRYTGNIKGFLVVVLIAPFALWPLAFPRFIYEKLTKIPEPENPSIQKAILEQSSSTYA